jgi:hypothetical protein
MGKSSRSRELGLEAYRLSRGCEALALWSLGSAVAFGGSTIWSTALGKEKKP